MRISAFFIVIFAMMCFGSIATRANKDLEFPKFSDYKIAPAKFSVASSLDLSSHKGAWMYRTSLRNGFKGAPDFAQKFIVVTNGCGTQCQSNWVLNKETGKVLGGMGSTYGLAYKLDSALIIANPEPVYNQDWSKEENQEYVQTYRRMVGGARYYVVNDDELELILDNSGIMPSKTKNE